MTMTLARLCSAESQDEGEFGKDLERSNHGLIKELSQHLPSDTMGNHTNPWSGKPMS